MSRVMLDSASVAKLLAQVKPVDVCDEKGRVVGKFTPEVSPALFERLEPQLSDEEVAELLRETRGKKLADVLRELEQRS